MSSRPFVVVVAGGSASGKSTLCAGLVGWFGDRGVGCEFVGVDRRFWKTLEEGGPGVDFVHDGEVLLDVNHVDVVDAEGVLAYVDELGVDVVLVDCHLGLAIEELRERMDLGVYVELEDDLRVVRRILRDMKDEKRGRGGDLDYIASWYMASARPGHERFIAPSREHANLVVRGDADVLDVVGGEILRNLEV